MDTTVNTTPKVQLVWITPNAESIIAEIARVSNPSNQKNPDYTGLVKYLIKHKHWSPFEMSSMCVKITTSRAIAAQILRHRSFSFQEFSQRYSEVTDFEPIELRKQAVKNRQSSLEVFNPYIDPGMDSKELATETITDAVENIHRLYLQLLKIGVAKEVARMILPLTTQTTLYMTGSARSFIHYLQLRTKEDTQKEHRIIAQEIEKIFAEQYPLTYAAYTEQKKEEETKELLWRLLQEDVIQLP